MLRNVSNVSHICNALTQRFTSTLLMNIRFDAFQKSIPQFSLCVMHSHRNENMPSTTYVFIHLTSTSEIIIGNLYPLGPLQIILHILFSAYLYISFILICI
jgi:hypothetical protein